MNVHKLDILQIVQQKLDTIEIHNTALAQLLCRVIPSTCPFERNINLFGYLIMYIPPLCKLNPLYNQLIELRFRASCYLAQHHENASKL
ncbi:Mo-dependent nitrogenase C-terminal domain-containing protein [Nostoc punctiforme]|uniref:Mo-dependent nitrogenase family protein n=1 Tax=Nostoc punctiforme (strain ATCC 29133 / PCC 73102) TaxID=63737 RepID=B2J552_NOSP7|nr:Mo-dependent nitrogenase C-terminal domain-containing protein [Nostoc punctiforme]ACC80712.1 Mo-dependent nitrogenase family protein [Nostoc punctiforme PCC 73102]